MSVSHVPNRLSHEPSYKKNRAAEITPFLFPMASAVPIWSVPFWKATPNSLGQHGTLTSTAESAESLTETIKMSKKGTSCQRSEHVSYDIRIDNGLTIKISENIRKKTSKTSDGQKQTRTR